MSHISPFVGLLFDRSRVDPLELVTTPPYDVISPAEQRRYMDASPHNIVRLDLAEDHPGDDEVENKYRRAACDYRRWRDEGVLVPTVTPAYYAYEMRFTLHGHPLQVRGLIGAVELEDWGGSIVPHERTMPGPVEDRLRLMRALRANLSSIHAVLTSPCPALQAFLDRSCRGDPAATVSDEEGVEHRLWVAGIDEDLTEELADRSMMIADGHHRYTTSLLFRDEMRAERGPGPWDQVMMLVVDAASKDVPVLPYHRVLPSGDVAPEGARVRDLQEVLAAIHDDPPAYGLVAREDGELSHRVARLSGRPPAVCALHEEILRGEDQELWFTPDAVEAEDAVRQGRAVAAFFLPATSASRIRMVVDGGHRLPRKSTYFWPKPRTGMVIRPLDEPELTPPRSSRAS